MKTAHFSETAQDLPASESSMKKDRNIIAEKDIFL